LNFVDVLCGLRLRRRRLEIMRGRWLQSRQRLSAALLALLCATLVSCGGGSGGSDTPSSGDTADPVEATNAMAASEDDNTDFYDAVGEAMQSQAAQSQTTQSQAAQSQSMDGFKPAGDEPLSVELRWRVPSTRLNGDALSAEAVRGHVIIFFSKTDLKNATEAITQRIGSLRAFRAAQQEIGRFIHDADLAQIVVTGSPHAVIVPAPQSSFRLQDLDKDTYYIAISAYDWQGQYSPLSETVVVEP
jgi:hypothetical protein